MAFGNLKGRSNGKIYRGWKPRESVYSELCSVETATAYKGFKTYTEGVETVEVVKIESNVNNSILITDQGKQLAVAADAQIRCWKI